MHTKKSSLRLLLPVILLLSVTLPHLDQGDFRTDTARYAAVGLQAWRDPHCFWVPHLHPTMPYFNKPPLVFWIHGAWLRLCGVHLAVARLPSILAALGCVLLTVAITRQLLGPTMATTAGSVLALTYEFFRRTREISLDMWQLLFMLLAVWLAVLATRSQRRRYLVLAGVPLGLALLCKPLMALLVLPILALWWAAPAARLTDPARGGLYPALPATLLVALLVAAPWHVAMAATYGREFTAQYFGAEILARVRGQIHAAGPAYYLRELSRTGWPWLPIFLFGLIARRTRRTAAHHRTGFRLAALWLAVWFVALTAFPDKRPRYALPLYPMAAVITAYGLHHLPWRRLRAWQHRGGIVLAALAVVLALLAAVLPLQVQAPPDPHFAALLNWTHSHGAAPLYSAALETNDEGYFYLRTGSWPLPTRTRHGRRVSDLPAGAYLIYRRGLFEVQPGPNETTVFQSGPLLVTRLGAGGWQPASSGTSARHRSPGGAGT